MASDQSENDSRNRCAFVSLQNCSSELAALVAGGKLFQARAAATGNAEGRTSCRRHQQRHGVGRAMECYYIGVLGRAQTTARKCVGSQLQAVG